MKCFEEVKQQSQSWSEDSYFIFDDGDICDVIDMSSLIHTYQVASEESDWDYSWGSKFHEDVKTDYIGLGLNIDSYGLSFEITNKLDTKSSAELAAAFHWYLTIDVSTGVITVIYSEKKYIEELSKLNWYLLKKWLLSYKPLLFVKEYREKNAYELD